MRTFVLTSFYYFPATATGETQVTGYALAMLFSAAALDAALFDLDGTLVRTFIDFDAMRTAMRDLSQQAGTESVTNPQDDILEIVRVMVEAKGGLQAEEGCLLQGRAYQMLEAMEREGCAHPQTVEGACELLNGLRDNGVRVGIITRNCRAVSEELLARMHLTHDLLVAREDTPEFKPHPAPVLTACARLQVVPARASMTGDLWADVASGQAAGVALTIGIQWAHDPPERFARARPDIEVSSLGEAARYLLPQAGR